MGTCVSVCVCAHVCAYIKGMRRRQNLGKDGLRSGSDISVVCNSLLGGQVTIRYQQLKRRGGSSVGQ